MIYLSNVHFSYKFFSIFCNLKINIGETVSIIGSSGSGKSTLLNIISGFVIIKSGNLYLNGKNCTNDIPSVRPVSMIFQENNLFSHLTVFENIGIGLNPKLKLTNSQIKKIEKISHKVGLNNFLNKFPSEISGGQRQRVAIARCLLRNKPILLLDEPFSSLDLCLQFKMIDLIKKISEKKNITILIVSHNHNVITGLTNRSLLLSNGKICFDGSTIEAIEKYKCLNI